MLCCLSIRGSEGSDSWAHGVLEIDGLDVVPSFLRQGDKEVHSLEHIFAQFFFREVLVSNGKVQSQHFLELELDGLLVSKDLGTQRRGFVHHLRESVNSVQNWSHQLGDGLDEGVSGQKHVVFLGPFLDKFLVLVKLGQEVNVNLVDIKFFFGMLV